MLYLSSGRYKISETENLRLSYKIPKDKENALQGMIAVAK
jgi:hypothetical protein